MCDAKIGEVMEAVERELRLFRGALDCLPVSINIKDANGRYAYINTYQANNAGMAAKDIIGQEVGVAVTQNPAWKATIRERDRRVLETGEVLGPYRDDFASLFGFKGTWLTLKAPFSSNNDGRCDHVVTISFDVTAFVEIEDQLRAAAYTDALTGLLNRRWLDEELERLEASAVQTNGRETWLLLVDADHFKLINDTYGHDVGDWVLCEVGVRLKQSVQLQDAVVRLGGEEFVVLVRNATRVEAAQAAERIRAAFDGKPTLQTEAAPVVTVSIGGAPARRSAAGESALKCADRALYLAKESGRNRSILVQRDALEQETSAQKESAA